MLFRLPGLLPHQQSQIQDGSVQDTSASLPFYLSAYHPVCSMAVVAAVPRSLSGMQCKTAKTTSSHCGGLSGKMFVPSVCSGKIFMPRSLFFRRGFLIGFVLLSSPSSTKLFYRCIPLVMAELTAVMAATSTVTLEYTAKRHPPSSSNGIPASSKETGA